MSFKRKSYTLRWPEGHALHGLIVKLRGLSLEDLAAVTALQGLDAKNVEFDTIRPVVEIMSKKMISWNMTDEDDNPVPTDVASLAGEDFMVIMSIIDGWQQAITSISASLGKGSNSGKPFPEESIPMETSSPNPPN